MDRRKPALFSLWLTALIAAIAGFQYDGLKNQGSIFERLAPDPVSNFELVNVQGELAFSWINPRNTDFFDVQIPGNEGDFEQRNPSFYQHVSYIELFIMAAANGRYTQVFNYADPCCSQNSYAWTYRDYVQEMVSQLGGEFQVRIDDSHAEHQISKDTLDWILMDLLAEKHQ